MLLCGYFLLNTDDRKGKCNDVNHCIRGCRLPHITSPIIVLKLSAGGNYIDVTLTENIYHSGPAIFCSAADSLNRKTAVI